MYIHERIPQLDGHQDNSPQYNCSVFLPDRSGRFVPALWYACEKCDFRSTSEDQLKKHNIKKHKTNKHSRKK